MQNLQDIQRDTLSASLDAIGGEPLAGSGFETEEPESGFSNMTRLGSERLWRPQLPNPRASVHR